MSVSEVTLADWLKVLAQLAYPAEPNSLDENCPFPDLAKQAADTMLTQLMGLYDYLSSLNELVDIISTCNMYYQVFL